MRRATYRRGVLTGPDESISRFRRNPSLRVCARSDDSCERQLAAECAAAPELLELYAVDPVAAVRAAVARNPRCPAALQLQLLRDPGCRDAIALGMSLSPEVERWLVERRSPRLLRIRLCFHQWISEGSLMRAVDQHSSALYDLLCRYDYLPDAIARRIAADPDTSDDLLLVLTGCPQLEDATRRVILRHPRATGRLGQRLVASVMRYAGTELFAELSASVCGDPDGPTANSTLLVAIADNPAATVDQLQRVAGAANRLRCGEEVYCALARHPRLPAEQRQAMVTMIQTASSYTDSHRVRSRLRALLANTACPVEELRTAAHAHRSNAIRDVLDVTLWHESVERAAELLPLRMELCTADAATYMRTLVDRLLYDDAPPERVARLEHDLMHLVSDVGRIRLLGDILNVTPCAAFSPLGAGLGGRRLPLSAWVCEAGAQVSEAFDSIAIHSDDCPTWIWQRFVDQRVCASNGGAGYSAAHWTTVFDASAIPATAIAELLALRVDQYPRATAAAIVGLMQAGYVLPALGLCQHVYRHASWLDIKAMVQALLVHVDVLAEDDPLWPIVDDTADLRRLAARRGDLPRARALHWLEMEMVDARGSRRIPRDDAAVFAARLRQARPNNTGIGDLAIDELAARIVDPCASDIHLQETLICHSTDVRVLVAAMAAAGAESHRLMQLLLRHGAWRRPASFIGLDESERVAYLDFVTLVLAESADDKPRRHATDRRQLERVRILVTKTPRRVDAPA